MAVNVHSGSNVFVAQTLLGYLDINALQQHDGRTKVSEIMEPTLWQVRSFLQLCQHLTKIFRIDRLAVRMNNDVISGSILLRL